MFYQRKRVLPLITHSQLHNPQNMDAVIQYATKRYKSFGEFSKRLLPKIDAEILIAINESLPTRENLIGLARLLRQEMVEEYKEIAEKDQEQYKKDVHEALSAITEISEMIGLGNARETEIYKEVDMPFLPEETVSDFCPRLKTWQTVLEEVHNAQQISAERFNNSIPTEEDMQQRITI